MRFVGLLANGFLALVLSFASNAGAQVQVEAPWARATVPGQQSSGAFMKLRAQSPTRLVAVSTPAAAIAEIHEMRIDDGVMRMRALEAGIALPAGESVLLEPGGRHLMLMQLQQPLAVGSSIPLTLVFERADGTRESLVVNAEVRALGARMPAGMQHHRGGEKP